MENISIHFIKKECYRRRTFQYTSQRKDATDGEHFNTLHKERKDATDGEHFDTLHKERMLQTENISIHFTKKVATDG